MRKKKVRGEDLSHQEHKQSLFGEQQLEFPKKNTSCVNGENIIEPIWG